MKVLKCGIDKQVDKNLGPRELVPNWISETLVLETMKLFRQHYAGRFDEKDAMAAIVSVGRLADVLF